LSLRLHVFIVSIFFLQNFVSVLDQKASLTNSGPGIFATGTFATNLQIEIYRKTTPSKQPSKQAFKHPSQHPNIDPCGCLDVGLIGCLDGCNKKNFLTQVLKLNIKRDLT
jgi:hypothetical protein